MYRYWFVSIRKFSNVLLENKSQLIKIWNKVTFTARKLRDYPQKYRQFHYVMFGCVCVFVFFFTIFYCSRENCPSVVMSLLCINIWFSVFISIWSAYLRAFQYLVLLPRTSANGSLKSGWNGAIFETVSFLKLFKHKV